MKKSKKAFSFVMTWIFYSVVVAGLLVIGALVIGKQYTATHFYIGSGVVLLINIWLHKQHYED
jgi:hypothetical protein